MAAIILNDFRCDSKPTHVSMVHPKGKYNIPETDTRRFYDTYCSSYENHMYGIAEVASHKYIPILVDVDLKAPSLSNDDIGYTRILYKFFHVERLVFIYQQVLREIIQDVRNEHLRCFFLEKPSYTITKSGRVSLKNGFHVHFPFIWLDRQQQENILLPKVRAECKKRKTTTQTLCSLWSGSIGRASVTL